MLRQPFNGHSLYNTILNLGQRVLTNIRSTTYLVRMKVLLFAIKEPLEGRYLSIGYNESFYLGFHKELFTARTE